MIENRQALELNKGCYQLILFKFIMFIKSLCLCIVSLMYLNNVCAETIYLSKIIDQISQGKTNIIYSSDFLRAERIQVDDEILNINQLKHYLESNLKLTIVKVLDEVYLIQPLELTPTNNPFIIVVEVIDSDTKAVIKKAQILSENDDILITYDSNKIFISLSKDSLPLALKAEAKGYFSDSQIVVEKNDRFVYELKFILKKKPYKLDKISVTTSHHDFNDLFNANQKIVTRDELELAPNFGNDVSRAVANLPGLSSNGITARYHVRGGKQNESQVILNGLSLRNPYHFKDFFGIFSSINLSYIEDLSLFSGVFPAKYGSFISSVMDIKSTTSDDSVIQTSLGTLNSYVTASGKLKNNDNYILSLRSGGDLLRSGLVDLEIGKPSYNDAFFNYQHTFQNGSVLTTNILHTRDQVDLNFINQDELATAQYNDNNYWLQFNKNINDQWSSSFMAFYQSSMTDRNGLLDDDELQGDILEARKSSISGLRNEFIYDKNNNSFSVGFNIQNESTDIRYQQNIMSSDFISEVLGIDLTKNNRNHVFKNSGNAFSLFTNYNTALFDGFKSDFGIRFDYQDWINEVQISPRINISYHKGNYIYKLGFGRHYQNQFIDDVLLEDAQLNYFRPEYADIAIFELQKNINNNYLLSAELYYKKYGNVHPYFENLFLTLHLHPQLFSDRVRVSPSSAFARGLDLRVKSLNDSFNWEAIYSFSDAKDIINGEEFFRSWDQRNTFKFLMGWQLKNWQFSSLLQYHSGWPRTNLSLNNDEIVIGKRNAERNKYYLNLDFKVSYTKFNQNSKVEYWLQLINATNRRNQCCFEYSYEENEFGQLEFETEIKSWISLIPAFGVNITF